MTNSEKVVKVIKTLEENHINLYHDVTKEEIDNFVKSIAWNKLSKIEFDRDMLKLFAMFKDAHTNFYVYGDNSRRRFNKSFEYINKKLFLIDGGKYYVVKTINDKKYTDVAQEFKPLLNYETEAWKSEKLNKFFNCPYCYEMIGMASQKGLKVETERNHKQKTFMLTELTKEELEAINKNQIVESYSYEILPDNILYLKYPICQENKEIPFKNLVNEIKKEYKEKGFNKYILDLRGNCGGDSEILNPFQEFVMKNKLKGVLLIDNGVFSSGRIAVARFKDKCNVTLIGQATGGAAKSYGYNKNLQLDELKFSCSIRLWDFSEIFGCTGSIKPDLSITNPPIAREKGRDLVLETAQNILKENNTVINISNDRIKL